MKYKLVYLPVIRVEQPVEIFLAGEPILDERHKDDSKNFNRGTRLMEYPGAKLASQGPQKPGFFEAAIEIVRDAIRVDCPVVRTHRIALVGGVEAPTVTRAIAIYLLGAGILQAVRIDLSLALEFLGVNVPLKAQLRSDVSRTIGENNAMARDFIENRRNPWIAEGIGHLLLSLSIHCPNLGPPGQLTALTQIHVDVTEHGLDLVGLHEEDGGLGLCVGEAKASSLNASQHLGAASALFAEIDAGKREMQIRQKVQLLSAGRGDGFHARLTEGFWRNRRAYLPIVAYSSNSGFEPVRNRRSLERLAVDSDRIRLVCVVLEDYGSFFDAVADHMRAVVDCFPEGPDVR